ncbi:immune inhibitor A [Paenibacillus larvae]|nr:immune inhibitor A domain-containing protein [Paenibacillus larvae]MDT2240628.1 immune inhibitor A [Paenibacillus larvae]MDT2255986.1 immune inhibitor A [Paenibacillus larvae]
MAPKKKAFTDNAVVALIEFPDYKHNQIKKGQMFWTADFSPVHYKQLLFNPNGYTTKEGFKTDTMTQYYNEQSAATWNPNGTVTPWIMAQNNAAYYGAHKGSSKDANPRELVKGTLEAIGKQIAGNEALYDQRDPYDLDGDGNTMEPDGILDNLFIVHSGMGEDAIWAHRSTLRQPVEIPGTKLKAYDYIIQPEDGAIGVFVHEYGHNLGLPDEYDTAYSGSGSPIEAWSVMSGGSWSGQIPGTEPTGFSPWAKLFLSKTYGLDWPTAKTTNFDELKNKQNVTLSEAVEQKKKGKILKIDLPDVPKQAPTQPIEGKNAYFSTKGDRLTTSMMSTPLDLTESKSVQLTFDSWRDIEKGYDFLNVNAIDESGGKTKVKAYSDTTGKWVTEKMDLSGFVGKKVKLEFEYVTDEYTSGEGAFLDNIQVEADGSIILKDQAEGTGEFTLNGFKVFDGSPTYFPNYYLVEYRTHNGVDKGLLHRSVPYDPGMVVWYYDGRYEEDNQTGKHPGYGFLGVVDAHQTALKDKAGKAAKTSVQIKDAAFGFDKTRPIQFGDVTQLGLPGIPTFSDGLDYSTPFNPAGGKILPKNGINIKLKSENKRQGNILLEVSIAKNRSLPKLKLSTNR